MAFRQQQAKALLQVSSRILAEQKGPAVAEGLAHRAVNLNPYEGYAWFYYGTALYLEQQFAESSKALNEGIRFLPHSYNALRLLALSNYRLGDYKQAAAQLNDYLTMIPIPPVSPELVLRMAGLAFLRLGDLSTSNFYLLKTATLAEDKGDLFRVRATVALLCNQPWTADYYYRAFRNYLPEKEFHPFELISNAARANKLPVTTQFLESVVSRNPEDVSLVKALATAYKATGNNAKAGAVLAAAIKKVPDNPDLHLMYGDILYKENKLPEAFKHYEEHLRLQPDSPFRKAILQRKAVSRY